MFFTTQIVSGPVWNNHFRACWGGSGSLLDFYERAVYRKPPTGTAAAGRTVLAGVE